MELQIKALQSIKSDFLTHKIAAISQNAKSTDDRANSLRKSFGNKFGNWEDRFLKKH